MTTTTAAALDERLFKDESHFAVRFVTDYTAIAAIADAVRARGLRIVLTSGSFDILHEGHSLYFEAARALGDFLIVGIDSDEKVQLRKGPGRPIVGELERARMVAHQRGVNLVTLKEVSENRWALVHAVRPDVLVATDGIYSPEEIDQLEGSCCGRVALLERMATTCTTSRLQEIQVRLAQALGERVTELLPELIRRATQEALAR